MNQYTVAFLQALSISKFGTSQIAQTCATVTTAFRLLPAMDTNMTTPPVGVERRVGQRFAFNLPVSVRDVPSSAEGLGFTQDLSSRGAFFFTDMPLIEGAEIELTLRMPSEITLGENMRVRCRGRVLRIVKAGDEHKEPTAFSEESEATETKSTETKIGVAVCLSGYEYLPDEDDGPAEFRRISALHANRQGTTPVTAEPCDPRSSQRPL
jgi:hypothetical protein